MVKSSALVFIGAAGSGKDTAADAVREAIPGARNLKFAAALKDVCARIYGWDRERLDIDLEYKEAPAYYANGQPCVEVAGEVQTRRQLLQHIGTDMFRRLNDNVWLHAAMAEVYAAPPAPLWVATDTRFNNEVAFIREQFDRTYVVRLVRMGATEGTAASAHVSERQSAEIEVNTEIHVGDGDVATLQRKAVDVALRFAGLRFAGSK
tara:strand:+ start:3049 stop:3669 length:621 start_codon:yes stop_codon:yes gene_type:complete